MKTSRTVAEVLRASLARPRTLPRRTYTVAELAGIGAAARYHGVAGYVRPLVAGWSSLPGEDRRLLDETQEATILWHLRTLGDLHELAAAFSGAGVPWLVVKGPTLAVGAHGSPSLRAYNDLDIVVPAAHLADAIAALEARGTQVLDRNWSLIHATMKGEVHLTLPSGTALDLHWHLLNSSAARDAFTIRMAELFERHVLVSIDGVLVPTLHPADELVYVALHLVRSGADRLIWLKDLECLFDRAAASCDDVVARAHSWDAELVLSVAIQRMRLSIGCPALAAEVADALPTAHLWLGLDRAACSLSPTETAAGRGSLPRMLARSTRGTQAESLREFGRRSVDNLRQGRAVRGDLGGRALPATDPRAATYDAGGATEREAYLRAVAAQG
jgi:hypothetical protein